MGDQIEISTRGTIPEERRLFYKVPFGGMKVDIKSSTGNASIGLIKTLDEVCDIWIVIRYNNRTWIKKGDESPAQIAETPNILSGEEYRSFWISWHGLSLQFGRDGETNPIVQLPDIDLKDLKYVVFAVKGSQYNETVNWRFELPPVIKSPQIMPITGGQMQWMHAENQLPDGAVIGGYEKDALYIIRAKHNGSLTVGKFVSSEGVSYIPWGGESHEKDDFEILVGYDYTWVPSQEDNIPVGAIVGGYAENTGEKLYIGRAREKEHLIPGKVQLSHGVCYIPFNGREIGHKNYEVLVGPNINTRCANRSFKNNAENDYLHDFDYLEEHD